MIDGLNVHPYNFVGLQEYADSVVCSRPLGSNACLVLMDDGTLVVMFQDSTGSEHVFNMGPAQGQLHEWRDAIKAISSRIN